ncbi:MAG: metalloregulator ArsR/SmtB family transcription factor [Solirubrobacteraceae bacterium]|jgi:DNA-binding transcriptional ArsR family regulator
MLNLFQVVADPTRRGILDLLRERERSVGELVERFTLTQPAVSRHLRELREAGLVSVRRDGQRRVYVLRPERLVEIAEWADRFRRP